MNIYYLIGGIIDIIVYEVMEDGNFKEFIKVIGGDWGGIRVDREYFDFIKCLIGEVVINDFNKNLLNVFFEVCREFELVKRIIKLKFDIKLNVCVFFEIREMYKRLYLV